MRQIHQEETLSRAEYLESIQQHFAERIGSKDYAHTGAPQFTLREEEAEKALDQAGGCTRPAMALILKSMDYTDKDFRREAEDLYRVRINLEKFSQDAVVNKFFCKLQDQIRIAKQIPERSPSGSEVYV